MTLENRGSLHPFIKDAVKYYEHQVTGVRTMAYMQNFLCADDMGLGKSLQALTVAAIDLYRGWCEKIIIVCPVTLRGNWADEITKFTGGIQFMMFGETVNKDGNRKKLGPAARETQLKEFAEWVGPRILVCNYEQLIPHVKQLNRMAFDIAIFDEAHYIKNYQGIDAKGKAKGAARSIAAHQLKTKRTMLLTGTPLLNQVNELWSLLHKMDPVAYPNYWSFVNRYCVFGGFKNKQITGVKNEKELLSRLQNYMVRRLKADVLDLPDVQIIQRRVDLTDSQRKLYDEANDNLKVEMQGFENPTEIENALTKFLRLKQICGTTLPFTGVDESSKLDLAIEDAIEVMKNGHKIVVFTQFRAVLEAFCQRLEAHGKKHKDEDFDVWELHGDVRSENRQPIVHEWSAPSLDAKGKPKGAAIVCMLQIAGVGLNMTASRHAFFVDKLFVPGLNQQAIDRLHRIGASATQPVQVYEYICRKTIENRVEQILTTKKKVFNSIVNDDQSFKKRLIAALMAEEEEDTAA